VLLGLNVVAQPFDRGVQELDRENEEDAPGKRRPGPHVRRDEEGQGRRRQAIATSCLIADSVESPSRRPPRLFQKAAPIRASPPRPGRAARAGGRPPEADFTDLPFRLLTHRIGSPNTHHAANEEV